MDDVRLRPSFFEHWDTAVVDWTFVAKTEESELEVGRCTKFRNREFLFLLSGGTSREL